MRHPERGIILELRARPDATPSAPHRKQIAAELRISPATVSRIFKRLGLNRIDALEPTLPVRRYEREKLGEMIHIDIKKLGRFNKVGHRIAGDPSPSYKSRGEGWEFVHVAVDDRSRIAFAKVMRSERKRSAIAFLKAALAYYASLGVTIERVMTDNERPSPSAEPASGSGSDTSGPALHATDQRQGRAIHPDQPARVGLRSGLSKLPTATSRTAALAAPLQLAQTTRRH